MKILLVEDLDHKAEQIETLISEALGVSQFQLSRARSFNSAVKSMEEVSFDLLLLDIMLPTRDGEEADKDGGRQVLLELMEGQECRHPSHIICLSAYKELESVIGDRVHRCLFHFVLYEETNPTWKETLVSFLGYAHSRLCKESTVPACYDVDVAIVTSRPSVELRAVLGLSTDWKCEYNKIDCLYYYRGTWKRHNGLEISVVACEAPLMGMTAACITSLKVIERWRPRFLSMCGIAAATTKEAKGGDIIVAEAVYDYGSGKITEDEAGDSRFVPRPNQLHISPELHSLLQRWESSQKAMPEIKAKAKSNDRLPDPRMILGLIATGAAVVQSRQYVEDLLENSQKTIGLDMEAYAVFHAAQLCSTPRPEVLVAKSVSDHADKGKSDEWQDYAARTSAAFIHAFFTTEQELSSIDHVRE